MNFLGILRSRCLDKRQNSDLFFNKKAIVKQSSTVRKRKKRKKYMSKNRKISEGGNQEIEQCIEGSIKSDGDMQGRPPATSNLPQKNFLVARLQMNQRERIEKKLMHLLKGVTKIQSKGFFFSLKKMEMDQIFLNCFLKYIIQLCMECNTLSLWFTLPQTYFPDLPRCL